MLPDVAGPPTRAEWVDTQLRRAILHGELPPGEKLYAERLAEQWGVSVTPVRETFQRLAGEGLVVIEPQRGARVASLSVAEAVEVYELRLLLDPAALQRSMTAAAGDERYTAEVARAHEAVARRHRTAADYHDAHRAFHLSLLSRCPNERMLRQIAQLLDQSQRFHAAGVTTVRRGDPMDEHRELAEAVMARDRRAAVAVLRRHLQATLDAVIATA
jgi:GntR family carbon starvation induced transcriptional regulator